MTCRTVKGGLSANGGGGIWSPWVASDRPVDRIESACASPHTSPAVLSGLLRPAQHMPGEMLRCAPLPFDIMA